MSKKVKVGKIKKQIIDLLELNLEQEKNIFLFENQKSHFEKHRDEFEDLEKVVEEIPNIISNPDYVGLHNNKNSVRYIKRLDNNVLVAVRLNNKNANVRTLYKITDDKIKKYLELDKIKKV